MKLIAFSGGMGCGKSTAIEILQEQNPGKKIVLIKFAAALYDLQEQIYARVESAYQRPAEFTKDRKLLQWLGTEWGRSLDENLWVNIWKAEVERTKQLYRTYGDQLIIVCDDCRFDNEAQIVKETEGTIIKITCDRAKERITTANGIANHASEAGIDAKFVDLIIENNGTLDEYKDSLAFLYNKFEIGRG